MCLNREYFNKSLGFFLNTKLIFKEVYKEKEKNTKKKPHQELYVCKRDDEPLYIEVFQINMQRLLNFEKFIL